MKKLLLLLATVGFMLAMPALSFASYYYNYYDAWITHSNFKSTVKVCYADYYAGKSYTKTFQLTNSYGEGWIALHGPDYDNNSLVAVINDSPGNFIRTDTLGTATVKGNTEYVSASWDAGAEIWEYTFLSLDWGYYYMGPSDVNASYSETKMALNPSLGTVTAKIVNTIDGNIYVGLGYYPAKITITTSTSGIPWYGYSWFDSFDRPFAW